MEEMLHRIAALCVLGAIVLLGQSSSDVTAGIISDLRAGKYAEAKGMSEEALKKAPNDERVWTLNGFALLHLGNEKAALASYKRAIEISADYLPALEGAAEIEYKASDQHAVPLLEKVLKANPHDETSHAMLASLAFKRGDCESAARNFAESQSLIASQISALEQYGSCLVRLRRTEDAIPVFQRLSDAQPQDAKARYNLAVVESLAGHDREVIAVLAPLLDKNPPDADSLALSAEAYEAMSDTPQAVAAIRRAIVTKPDVSQYYLNFANICLAHGSFQVGIDMLNVGLKRIPDSAPLYLGRGILYIQLGQYEASESDFARAERLDPNVQFGSAVEGLAELQRNDLGEAELTIRSRLAKHPNDAFSHYLLVETLIRKGATAGSPQFSEAVKSAERAIQLQPNFPLARDVLSGLYLKQGDIARAIEQSRLAYSEDPSDQTALYHLIMALRKAGKTAELPALTKKLVEAREQARTKEATEHKFALVEVKPEQKSTTGSQ